MAGHAITIFRHLPQSHIDWILHQCRERQLAVGESLFREGQPIDTIYFVTDGMLAVSLADSGTSRTVDRLAAGDIVGELAFLTTMVSSVQVAAVEPTHVLALSKLVIEQKVDSDTAFAAALYKAVALSISGRLRDVYTQTAQVVAEDSSGNPPTWRGIAGPLDDLKSLLLETHRVAKAVGNVPDSISSGVRSQFKLFLRALDELIGDASPTNPRLRKELGCQVQREFLPYLLMTCVGERIYSKPRGYAGDYETIRLMYQSSSRELANVGQVLDCCLLETPAAQAVVNRRALMVDEISQVVNQCQDRDVLVTSLACGPAEEIFDAFSKTELVLRLQVTLLDFDWQALAHVADRRDKQKLGKRIELVNENLLYVALGRTRLPMAAQDLVYSIGLVDYLEDRLVIKLMDAIYEVLKPGGKVILGNFHPRNTTKAFMDYVLDWRLIHRSEADMNRLFQASRFNSGTTSVRFEEEGVNLFATCVRSR